MADDDLFSNLLNLSCTGGLVQEKSWGEFHDFCLGLEEGGGLEGLRTVMYEDAIDENNKSAVVDGDDKNDDDTGEAVGDTSFGKFQRSLKECKSNRYNWESIDFSDYGTQKSARTLYLAVMVGKLDAAELLLKHDTEKESHRSAVTACCIYNRPQIMEMMISSRHLMVTEDEYTDIFLEGCDRLNSPGYLKALINNPSVKQKLRDLCFNNPKIDQIYRHRTELEHCAITSIIRCSYIDEEGRKKLHDVRQKFKKLIESAGPIEMELLEREFDVVLKDCHDSNDEIKRIALESVDVLLFCGVEFHAMEIRRIFDEALKRGQDEICKRLIDKNENLLKILQKGGHTRTLYTYLYSDH